MLAIAGAGLYAWKAFNDVLGAYGIERLQWQGLDLSLTGLTLDRLAVSRTQPARALSAEARQLSLQWRWTWKETWDWPGLQMGHLRIAELDFELQEGSQPLPDPSSDGAEWVPPERLPGWLPSNVSVDRFSGQLPCATGRCSIEGSLAASRSATGFPLTAGLELTHRRHRLGLQLSVDRSSIGDPTTSPGTSMTGVPSPALAVTAGLILDGEALLRLQSRYHGQPGNAGNGSAVWSGEIAMPSLPQTDWLLEWLRQWQPLPEAVVAKLPPADAAAALNAQWRLRAPGIDGFASQASGALSLQITVPKPWPIPGIGALAGDIDLALAADGGTWQATSANADLTLTEPAAWSQALPRPFRPASVTVKVKPGVKSPVNSGTGTAKPGIAKPGTESPALPSNSSRLPLRVSMTAQGESPQSARISVQGNLALPMRAPWQLHLSDTHLQAELPEFSAGDWTLQGLESDLKLAGTLNADGFSLDFAKNSLLRIASIGAASAGIALTELNVGVGGLHLSGSLDRQAGNLAGLAVKGPVALTATRVDAPALDPQPWRFRGDLSGDFDGATIAGTLVADAGLNITLRLGYTPGGAITANADARVTGEAGGKTLARTLAFWPPALSLTQGSLQASADWRQPVSGPPSLTAELAGEEVSGIYDRTAFTALGGAVKLSLDDGSLAVATEDLSVDEINAGIPIGPVDVAAHYQASSAGPDPDPGNGKLRLERLAAGFIGGEVRAQPATWNLSAPPWSGLLIVDGLEVSQLMALYPAEGLSGTGRLNGTIPVEIGPKAGFRVVNGNLSAAPPGGVLQIPADRLQALGDNRALDLVAKAMEDFHYSQLTSRIDYAGDGTLDLGLHIEGSNPAVQQGQPIVLNINLEENIPALLTSLQLSGRVNDAITEKVRTLIRQRQTEGEASVPSG